MLALDLKSLLLCSVRFHSFPTYLDAFNALLGQGLGVGLGWIAGNASDFELLGGARVTQD